MTTASTEIDQAKPDAFAKRLLTALNHGALCLMVSIGHRTGLFDVMHEMDPATSEEIAVRAGLNERYVREWLGAMVTGASLTSILSAAGIGCRPSTPRC